MSTQGSELANHSAAALSYSNYRRFFFGNSLSNVGNWFQTLAQALLVIKITGRTSSLGLVFTIQTFPLLVSGPFIGSFFDRRSFRKILLVVSVFSCIQAFALAILVASHHASLGTIYVLCFLFGICQVFQQPAVKAIVSELLPDVALANGVSLNSVQQNVGRLAGPAIAGVIYAWRGATTCFVVNGLSYFIVIIALVALRPDQFHRRPSAAKTRRQFLEALSYVRHSPFHRRELLASLAIGCLAFNFPLVWASMTQFVLHSGSASLGLSTSVSAGSGLLTGLILARCLRRPTQRTYIISCLLFGLSLALAAVSPNIAWFYVTMVIFGVTNVVYLSVNQTVLQLNTPRERVGSVMTLLTYCQQGTTPIGSLMVAVVTSLTSIRYAVGVGAAASIGGGLWLAVIQARERPPALLAT